MEKSDKNDVLAQVYPPFAGFTCIKFKFRVSGAKIRVRNRRSEGHLRIRDLTSGHSRLRRYSLRESSEE